MRLLDLVKRAMRKLLLLDADVLIDLHTLSLFGKISKAYDVCLIRSVFDEARYYRKGRAKIDIDLKDVTIIDNVDLENHVFHKERHIPCKSYQNIKPRMKSRLAIPFETQ